MARRILVTGVGGQVAFPLARSLTAQGHEVWGLARLRKPEDRQRHPMARRRSSGS